MNSMVKNIKIRSILILVVITFVFGIIIFFNPIGQILNGDDLAKNTNALVSEPVFSVESGFYDEPFQLELSSVSGTKIYYTLDCTEPDITSIQYKDSILIENVTQNENVYSMLTNVSVGFYGDLIKKHNTLDSDPNYVSPDYLVDKCVVVRAVAVDEKGNHSKVKTNTYFVDEDISSFNGCNIVSITTSPENLFDDKIGIYVTGNAFNNYMKKNKITSYWRLWEANYRRRGEEWERPADFHFYNANGELVLSANGGIRVQGAISRATLPRSLNLFVGEKYGEGSVLNDQLFNSDFIPTKLTLTAGGNRLITLFNDYMMSDRTQPLNFSKMDFKPYYLFLEGEFWGFYYLTTAYDERYISYHYGVDEQDIVMIKNGSLEIGNDIDILLYDNMKKYITENDMSVQKNYKRACELIDIDSFLDYYACMAYIARNEDWPTSNYALWRSKSVSEGKYSDGKWRWMLFDCNSSSMMRGLINHDTLNYIINKDSVFASLWENNDFRLSFKEHLYKIADECFNSREMSDYIKEYANIMPPILEKSWARFYGSENEKEEEFNARMEEYTEFYDNRRTVVESWFE